MKVIKEVSYGGLARIARGVKYGKYARVGVFFPVKMACILITTKTKTFIVFEINALRFPS